MRLIKKRLTLLLFCLVPFISTRAANIPIKVTDRQQSYSITPSAELLKSNVSAQEIGEFMSAFKPLDLNDLALNSSPDNCYWFRFTISNETDERLYAILTVVGQSKVNLYEWDGHQAVSVGVGGMNVPANELFMTNSRPIFRLTVLKNQSKTYLFHTERLWVRSPGLVIYPEYALLASTEFYTVAMGLVIGILFCTILFQLCFYFLSRQIDYLWLGAQLLCGLGHHIVGSGLISGYLSLPPWLNATMLFYVFICLVGFFSLQFQRTFQKLDVYGNSFIRKTYIVFQGGYIFFIGIALLGKEEWFDWQTLFTGVVAPFCMYAIFTIYRQGFKPSLYLLLIQLLLLPFIPVLVLQQQGNMENSPMTNTFFIASGFQSILFSLLIGYKVKGYKDEAYDLIKKQNETLEDLIADRTKNLQVEKERADHQTDRLQLALRELNHRVKNNLAIVSSLLKLQSKAVDSTETRAVFQESRQRIDAMSLIHRQLYQSEEVTTIDMNTYIMNLAEGLCEAYGFSAFITLKLDLEPVKLPVEHAVPLGLIINEVLTNAFKYGLPKASMPRLHIKLKHNETLFLEIHNNGVGIDLAIWNQLNTSFGRRLIEGLGQQLRGRYELDGTSGTRFRFWMPTISEYTTLI